VANPIRLVIIGRPNVGKSTLFNRLFGRRRALVHDEPGVTRDRLEERVDWIFNHKKYSIHLVDTGGLGGERFAEEIENQVNIALQTADVVLMLFDGEAGLTSLDQELIQKLQIRGVHKKAKIIGVVNKVDANVHEDRGMDFYEAGLDPLLTISAEHNRGIDELKIAIIEAVGAEGQAQVEQPEEFPEGSNGDFEAVDPDSDEAYPDSDFETVDEDAEPAARKTPHIAVVGKPNVGKSTLINALMNEERMIVSPIAGTTIDSIDSTVILNDKEYLIMDTAGIRRKNKTEQGVEVLSVVQTRKALERAEVAILLMDGEEGIAEQDEKIGGLIEELGCSVILMMNKWDTHKHSGFSREDAAARIRGKMAYLKYAPILFVSAKKHEGLDDLGDLLEEILHQRRLKIPTHEFTKWVRNEATIHNPENAKFYMSHQAGRHPPTFVCHVSDPEKVHFSLRRHLVNALRERWGFMGTPIRMVFVKGGSTRRAKTRSERHQQ
jgi:GTP-binding protein